MLVDVALLLWLGVGDNAACQRTRYLTDENVLALRGLNDDVGTLVLFARLGQPRLVVVAVMMLDEFHAAVDGKPVGVYVPRTHEDADHQSFVVEISVFLHFFNHYNLAVGRSHHRTLGIAVEVANRAAVEVQRYQPGCHQNGSDEGRDDVTGKRTDGMKRIP